MPDAGALAPSGTDEKAGAAPGTGPAAGPGIGTILTGLRQVLSDRRAAGAVTLRDLVTAMGGAGFPVLVLLFALILVSPLSAIPGATTLLGLSIAALLAQSLLGRHSVWLPALVLDRGVPVARTEAALTRLDRPAGWVDRRLKPRLPWVFAAPLAQAPAVLVLAAALCAPLMEVIPASGTSVGAAIVVFSAGVLARDGLFVLAGAGFAAILPVSLWLVLT